MIFLFSSIASCASNSAFSAMRLLSRSVSISTAAEEEAVHLGIAAGDPVFWIVSITQTLEGVPVEYCRTVARADKVELVSFLHRGESEASDHA